MTNTDVTTERSLRIPRSDPEDRSNPDKRTHILTARRATWNNIVGRPSAFVQRPPVKFEVENFEGYQMIVRLMKNSEEMIAWNVEIQYSDMISVYYTLYYWNKPSQTQEYFNRQNLLIVNHRWAYNMTDTRLETEIDSYNPIIEMLE
ncbi:MAG: hypothetical protein VX626_03490, partial [Candidatus Thermoplasmatota archaeon]|nr:hypothetical protein [Candidatus Thermoplasmatota archaeon]